MQTSLATSPTGTASAKTIKASFKRYRAHLRGPDGLVATRVFQAYNHEEARSIVRAYLDFYEHRSVNHAHLTVEGTPFHEIIPTIY